SRSTTSPSEPTARLQNPPPSRKNVTYHPTAGRVPLKIHPSSGTRSTQVRGSWANLGPATPSFPEIGWILDATTRKHPPSTTHTPVGRGRPPCHRPGHPGVGSQSATLVVGVALEKRVHVGLVHPGKAAR